MSAPRTASAGAARRLDGQAAGGAQVARELGGGGRGRCRTGAASSMPEQVVEGQRLELALRAVADQRHACGCPAAPARGPPSPTSRRCGCAVVSVSSLSSSRRPGGHVGQHAEGHHRGQAERVFLRVAVDVLEGVGRRRRRSASARSRRRANGWRSGASCRIRASARKSRSMRAAMRGEADRQAAAAHDGDDVAGAQEQCLGLRVHGHLSVARSMAHDAPERWQWKSSEMCHNRSSSGEMSHACWRNARWTRPTTS